MSSDPKNVLIVELNEFNSELIQIAIKKHHLPALAKIWTFNQIGYRTPDRYNTGFLEPWVQWVSVHSGVPSSKHHIKHLGDVPDLGFKQCWEVLSEHDISCGVWGVMNGARNNAKAVPFFLPDPWTFTECATPPQLNNLLDLPRYVSKNYQNLSKLTLLRKGIKLLSFIATSKQGLPIFKEVFALFKNLVRYGVHHFVLISFFDVISTLLFSQYKKTYTPRVSILFLNSLAHLQHHHWHGGEDNISPEILHGLQQIDKIFAHLLREFPEDAIVVHNGLTQMNTNHEKPWVLYRQKDPLLFAKALGLAVTRVEQHMTHDAHLFFATEKDCLEAYTKLRYATIKDKPLFHVEKNAHDACKLFYQLKFTDLLTDKKILFRFADQDFPFFKYFDEIVTRTGRHLPIGNILSNVIAFPDHMNNHEFNQYLYEYLLPATFSSKLDTLDEFDEEEEEELQEEEIGELV